MRKLIVAALSAVSANMAVDVPGNTSSAVKPAIVASSKPEQSVSPNVTLVAQPI